MQTQTHPQTQARALSPKRESGHESEKKSDQESDQVTDKAKKILSYCIDSRSSAEILTEIGISNHTSNYKRHIEPLLEKELLQMTIPDSPKNRNQKYITTQKGREKLNM